MNEPQVIIERHAPGIPMIVRVTGDVGVAHIDRLNTLLRGLLESKPTCIILDLSETNNVGSMALGSLVHFNKLAKATGAKVRIAAPSQTALQGILLARLDTIFDVFATLDDAVAIDGDAMNGPVRVVTRPPTGIWGQQTSGDWPAIGGSGPSQS